MKRGIIAVLSAVLLFMVGTDTASADTFLGERLYMWPAHCDSYVGLYMDTWRDGNSPWDHWIQARLEVGNNLPCGAGENRASAIWVYEIILYRQRPGEGPVAISVDNTSAFFTLDYGWYHPLDQSPKRACASNQTNPAVQVGDTAWVFADYRVRWGDGSVTAERTDNSYAVTFNTGDLCT